ncbi:hypothetical protein GCM10025784_14110 [Citricoccus nitrophenolicus]
MDMGFLLGLVGIGFRINMDIGHKTKKHTETARIHVFSCGEQKTRPIHNVDRAGIGVVSGVGVWIPPTDLLHVQRD